MASSFCLHVVTSFLIWHTFLFHTVMIPCQADIRLVRQWMWSYGPRPLRTDGLVCMSQWWSESLMSLHTKGVLPTAHRMALPLSLPTQRATGTRCRGHRAPLSDLIPPDVLQYLFRLPAYPSFFMSDRHPVLREMVQLKGNRANRRCLW